MGVGLLKSVKSLDSEIQNNCKFLFKQPAIPNINTMTE